MDVYQEALDGVERILEAVRTGKAKPAYLPENFDEPEPPECDDFAAEAYARDEVWHG